LSRRAVDILHRWDFDTLRPPGFTHDLEMALVVHREGQCGRFVGVVPLASSVREFPSRSLDEDVVALRALLPGEFRRLAMLAQRSILIAQGVAETVGGEGIRWPCVVVLRVERENTRTRTTAHTCNLEGS